MKIATFNVNSIKARVDTVLTWFNKGNQTAHEATVAQCGSRPESEMMLGAWA